MIRESPTWIASKVCASPRRRVMTAGHIRLILLLGAVPLIICGCRETTASVSKEPQRAAAPSGRGSSPSTSHARSPAISSGSPDSGVGGWNIEETGSVGFGGVSCPTATFCVAVSDATGKVVTYNGTSWSQPDDIAPNASDGLAGVSCPATTSCMTAAVAVLSDQQILQFNGNTWSYLDSYPGGSVNSISCPTTSFCLVSDGQVYTFFNGVWSQPTTLIPGSDDTIVAVSCNSPTLCVAGDDEGNVFTYNGSTWSQPDSIESSSGKLGTSWAFSCPGPTLCVAGDNEGNVFTYNGVTWAGPDPIDRGTGTYAGVPAGGITSISCPSATFCVAGASDIEPGSAPWDDDDVFMYNGSAWSQEITIDRHSDGIWGVSCASSHFCIATDGSGDGGGHIFIYR